MEQVIFDAPDTYKKAMDAIRRVPFAKMEDGYRFASWVYDMNVSEQQVDELRESPQGQKAVELLEKAKAGLESILILEDEYVQWSIHKKETGGIKQYHKVLYDMYVGMLMLVISEDASASAIMHNNHKEESAFYSINSVETSGMTKQVLNRNNPFADVTIKSQHFFYKTADGGTETLFFDTNNIVEKTDKSGKDMFTMRPGFSVTKEYGVIQKPMQKVTFSGSMTEPIVDDEEHIYIHID